MGQVYLHRTDAEKLLTLDMSKTGKSDDELDVVAFTHPKLKVRFLCFAMNREKTTLTIFLIIKDCRSNSFTRPVDAQFAH